MEKIGNIYNVNGSYRNSLEQTRINGTILSFQHKATIYGDWGYYQKILDLRTWLCSKERQELLDKYPYDGKSTFAELLANELEFQR